MSPRFSLAALSIGLLTIAGCGGGGSSSSTTSLGAGVTASDVAGCLKIQHDWSSDGKAPIASAPGVFAWDVTSPNGDGAQLVDEQTKHPLNYDLRIASPDGHAVDVTAIDFGTLSDADKADIYSCAAG